MMPFAMRPCQTLCVLLLLSWSHPWFAAAQKSSDIVGKLVNRADEAVECRSKGIWSHCFSGFDFSQSKCVPYLPEIGPGEATVPEYPNLPPAPFHWKTKFRPDSDAPYCIECCSDTRTEFFFEDETWDLRCKFDGGKTLENDYDLYGFDFWFPVRGSKGKAPGSWNGDNCDELITRCPIKRPPPLQKVELYAPDEKRGYVFGDFRIKYNDTLTDPISLYAPARIKDEAPYGELYEGKSVEAIFEATFGIDIDVTKFQSADGYIWTLTFGATQSILRDLTKFEEEQDNWRTGTADLSGKFPLDGNHPVFQREYDGGAGAEPATFPYERSTYDSPIGLDRFIGLDSLGHYHYDGWDDEVYPNVTFISNLTTIAPEPNPIVFGYETVPATQLYGYRLELVVDEKSRGADRWKSVDGCKVDTFEGWPPEVLENIRGSSLFNPTVEFREQISLSKNLLSSSPKVHQFHLFSAVNLISFILAVRWTYPVY
jgi:hypothetical protein